MSGSRRAEDLADRQHSSGYRGTPVSSEDPVMMRSLSLVLSLAILAAAALPGSARAQNPGLDLIPEDALAGFAIKNLDDLRAKGDKLAKDLQVPERTLVRLTDIFKGTKLQKGMNMKGSVANVIPSLEKLKLENPPDPKKFLNHTVGILP